MDKFVAISSSTSLIGFALAFSVLLGLVVDNTTKLRVEVNSLYSIGTISQLSMAIVTEAVSPATLLSTSITTTNSKRDDVKNAFSSASVKSNSVAQVALDKVTANLAAARRTRQNTTKTVADYWDLYVDSANALVTAAGWLLVDVKGIKSHAMTSTVVTLLTASSLVLESEGAAWQPATAGPTVSQLKFGLAHRKLYDRTSTPFSTWLPPTSIATQSRGMFDRNITTMNTMRSTLYSTVFSANSAVISVSAAQRALQFDEISVISDTVQTLVDDLNTAVNVTLRQNNIYIILLSVGIVISAFFFVINVLQLVRRYKENYKAEVLLRDFDDISEGAVKLNKGAQHVIEHYTKSMKFMDVSELLEEPSEDKSSSLAELHRLVGENQIETSMRMSCSVLEQLRPFVPRGAFLNSYAPAKDLHASQTQEHPEEGEENTEHNQTTLTALNLSTVLVKTPAVVLLVGTPFLHHKKSAKDSDNNSGEGGDEDDADVPDPELISTLITIVHQVVEEYSGIVVHVNEDGILCVFNASIDEFTTTREGENEAVMAAQEIRAKVVEEGEDFDQAMPIVISIASAPCLVGNMVGPITSSFQVIGPNVLRALSLQPVALRHKLRIITDSHTLHSLQASWHMRPIEKVNTDPNDPITAYDILSRIPDMEEIDESTRHQAVEADEKLRDKISAWNKAWELYDGAKDHMVDLLDEAGKQFSAYRKNYVENAAADGGGVSKGGADSDPSLDIVQTLIRSRLKELLGMDFHDKE